MAVKREPLREVYGLESPELARVQDGVKDALRPLQRDSRPRAEKWTVPTDQTATTATAETPIWTADFDCLLERITYTPSVAMARDGTNYATFIFRLRDGSGAGTARQISRVRTADVDIRANQPFSFPLSGDRKLVTGTVLTLEVTKTAAGRSVTAGTISTFYRERAA